MLDYFMGFQFHGKANGKSHRLIWEKVPYRNPGSNGLKSNLGLISTTIKIGTKNRKCEMKISSTTIWEPAPG